MTFKEKIQSDIFWLSLIRVFIIFFVIMTIASLVINSGIDIFNGNFDRINQVHFANGKWKLFFSYKIIFSLLYALYTVNKKLK